MALLLATLVLAALIGATSASVCTYNAKSGCAVIFDMTGADYTPENCVASFAANVAPKGVCVFAGVTSNGGCYAVAAGVVCADLKWTVTDEPPPVCPSGVEASGSREYTMCWTNTGAKDPAAADALFGSPAPRPSSGGRVCTYTETTGCALIFDPEPGVVYTPEACVVEFSGRPHRHVCYRWRHFHGPPAPLKSCR
jgi:hypothetical protein